MTVFLTTHYLEEADSLCDRIAIIDEGVIRVIGSPHELKESLGGDVIHTRIEDEEDRTPEMQVMESVSSVTKDGFEYRIKTKDGDRTMTDILTASTGNGWKIKSISLEVPSMNQVFLEYTGKALRDEEGGSKFEKRTQAIQARRRQ